MLQNPTCHFKSLLSFFSYIEPAAIVYCLIVVSWSVCNILFSCIQGILINETMTIKLV